MLVFGEVAIPATEADAMLIAVFGIVMNVLLPLAV